jgi:pyruvate dehydrogenase (quinone)
MDKIASELLVERLADWGVDTVFGLPGDGINGIMEGLRRHQDKVRFVLVHHEEAAAFMAAGYAKATGKVGVCLATSGPGGLHLLNGLYDAKLDHAPVLAITGMQETAVLGTGHQQEVHLDRVFMDLADYNVLITVPASIPSLVDRAMRTSLARRTVSHLTFPNDLQVAPADAEPWPTVGPARTPATAPTSTTGPRSPCWSGRALSAPARRSWPPPRRWPARSSRPCRARPPCPTTIRSPPAGWGCSGPSRARRPSTSATPC